MVEMKTLCGRCKHYTSEYKCGNKISKHYGERQLANVCWNCADFDGEMYKWDTSKSHPIGDRPSTFGRVDPKDPTKFL